MKALQVFAGAKALAHLRERATGAGLLPQDIRVIPAAAGGPKGLILGPLDRFLFGHWLPQGGHEVHLIGASIGAWRMTAACMPDPDAALARLTEDYIAQDYPHLPGQAPTAETVSSVFGDKLREHFAGNEAAVLNHARWRLHVFTSRGQGVLARESSRWRTSLGYGLAFAANSVHRPAMGRWLERVVFSSPGARLPVPLDDFPSQQVPFSAANLQAAVLASCSIPFWLKAVHDIPGAPPGAYWDGGITDYHLHLRYQQMQPALAASPSQSDTGWVLYPHFQSSVIPGWLDKIWRYRHRATSALDRVILLAPNPQWVATLPNGKLPDRQDFKTYAEDVPTRQRVWRQAVAESQRLADEFAEWVQGGKAPDIQPLR